MKNNKCILHHCDSWNVIVGRGILYFLLICVDDFIREM